MLIDSSRALGLYLRDRRRELGLTQAETAAAAGVSQRWLSSLESGKSTAEVGLVFKTLRALRLTVDVRAASTPASAAAIDAMLRDLGAPT